MNKYWECLNCRWNHKTTIKLEWNSDSKKPKFKCPKCNNFSVVVTKENIKEKIDRN